MTDKGERILDAIYDDVDRQLNPSGEPCPECGDEGYTYDCFEEWACVDPEGGCSECARRCLGCAQHKVDRLRMVREEVIKLGDADTAIAWLKSIGRWRDTITRERVIEEMANASIALASPGT